MRDGAGRRPTDRVMGIPLERRLILGTFLLAAGTLLAAGEAQAQGAGEPRRGTEFSSQARPETRRPPTRLRVQPFYPYRRYSTDYPVPYEYEYPGPNGVRQCKAKLVQELRPSGPTVVPRMRCWWEVR
jgi:hypothetical protein